MNLRDSLELSAGNLKRMKLRSFLTTAGVIIAIGTFVAMLSFGAGNQKYAQDEFEQLGLFNTVQVYPLSTQAATDTTKPKVLDRAALEELGRIPGVRLAFPFDPFSVTVKFLDSQMTARAQSLSAGAMSTKYFSTLRAGHPISGDSAREAIVTMYFLRGLGVIDPDSALGKPIILSVNQPSVDSGLSELVKAGREQMRTTLKEIKFDSLINRVYVERLVRTQISVGMKLFVKGYLGHPTVVTETLIVTGVIAQSGPQQRGSTSIIVPEGTGRRLSAGIFSGDPNEIMAALNSGEIFSETDTGDSRTFPHVTLDLDPKVMYKPVADSVKALGFRPFSFAEQFEELKKMFFYFDLALGVIGIIALITASLGIINTMVMSVLERRREIGVLKSLGADERDIRFLFLVESSVIGLAGSVFGVLLGWTVTRIASRVAQYFMAKQGLPDIDLFALPLWLVAEALVLGLVVSIAAGYYPASRASRIDPVEALRNE